MHIISKSCSIFFTKLHEELNSCKSISCNCCERAIVPHQIWDIPILTGFKCSDLDFFPLYLLLLKLNCWSNNIRFVCTNHECDAKIVQTDTKNIVMLKLSEIMEEIYQIYRIKSIEIFERVACYHWLQCWYANKKKARNQVIQLTLSAAYVLL